MNRLTSLREYKTLMEKGEDGSYQHFLHCPHCFVGHYFLKVVKYQLFGKGLKLVYKPEASDRLLLPLKNLLWKLHYKRRSCSIWDFSTSHNDFFPLTPNQATNFGLFQTERVCRRQFQVRWKCLKVFETGRKHSGKRRNCSLRAISPFPSVFQKTYTADT